MDPNFGRTIFDEIINKPRESVVLKPTPITPKVVEEDTIPEALDPSRRQLRQT